MINPLKTQDCQGWLGGYDDLPFSPECRSYPWPMLNNIMNRAGRILLLSILICSSGSTLGSEDRLQAKALVMGGTILPLLEIIKQVAIDQPGHILEVEFEQKDGQYIYEIELVDKNGLVWEVKYNAKNGKLLEREQEN